MINSNYVGIPRNAEERRLSALPLELLLTYAEEIVNNPQWYELVKNGWDRELTSTWTDDQHEELGWSERKFAESFLTKAGYEACTIARR
ncbi:hypothetical protein [Aliiroseovarius sp. S253]|uniref:hypothetical protein n=1 Tax=Aliiroseovarius sp. S253 TaxID=3415133 RepID=UPI003C7EAF52